MFVVLLYVALHFEKHPVQNFNLQSFELANSNIILITNNGTHLKTYLEHEQKKLANFDSSKCDGCAQSVPVGRRSGSLLRREAMAFARIADGSSCELLRDRRCQRGTRTPRGARGAQWARGTRGRPCIHWRSLGWCLKVIPYNHLVLMDSDVAMKSYFSHL